MERLAGMRVVHVRKQNDVVTVDSRIAADGDTTRLLEVVTIGDDVCEVIELSDHDARRP